MEDRAKFKESEIREPEGFDEGRAEDLMLFADGELDAEAEAAVMARLQSDPHARSVVETIWEIGSQVRDVADQRARNAGADGVANWVMSRIEQEKEEEKIPLHPNKAPTSNVVEFPRRANSVWVAFGGLAVAATVALILWRFTGLDLAQPQPSDRVAVVPSPSPDLMVASATIPEVDYDQEPGVSVNAVDFGARTGTIFYVPGDTGTTTVVWLTDDEAGGNE